MKDEVVNRIKAAEEQVKYQRGTKTATMLKDSCDSEISKIAEKLQVI
jgi:hypothetical protein